MANTESEKAALELQAMIDQTKAFLRDHQEESLQLLTHVLANPGQFHDLTGNQLVTLLMPCHLYFQRLAFNRIHETPTASAPEL
jgi:hypothetical protein